MYALTIKKGDIDSGIYASVDRDGLQIIQFFVDEDDAMCYNTHLGALGYKLEVTKTPSENVDKFCEIAGCAYTIVEPGEVVFPRLETLQSIL
jgi:hypothetical protein